MKIKLTAGVTLTFQASAEKVWEGLTTPEMIKQYFYGTNAISDWKVGSPLLFRGEWEGKPYEDKGVILQSIRPQLFQYSYLSSWSGLADLPENYATITYELSEANGKTILHVTQDGVASEEMKIHSEENWKTVLTGLKKILEQD